MFSIVYNVAATILDARKFLIALLFGYHIDIHQFRGHYCCILMQQQGPGQLYDQYPAANSKRNIKNTRQQIKSVLMAHCRVSHLGIGQLKTMF